MGGREGGRDGVEGGRVGGKERRREKGQLYYDYSKKRVNLTLKLNEYSNGTVLMIAREW